MSLSRRLFLGGIGFAAAIITGCVNQTNNPNVTPENQTTQGGEKAINIYSSRHYNTDSQLYDGFTESTGIKVNLIEGKDDELIERIKNEGTNSPADILITVDAGRIWRADQEGLFTPVKSSVLEEKIPANLRHPEGHWFGFSKRARVIIYNKNKVKPEELSTYEDLANEKWKGRIAIRSSSNIYNQSLVASLIAILGEEKTEEWCKKIVENMARPPEGGDTDQIKAVAAGIADIAVVNTYYLARLGQSEKPEDQEIFNQVGVFFPNQNDRGTHVNISGGGVIKSSKNQEEAVQFLEYLASEQAQEFFAQGNNEYPVVDGIESDPIVTGFGTFKTDTLNVNVYGENNAKAIEIMDRAGWK